MDDVGRGYGCGVAIVIAIVPVFPLAFVLAWSGAHCEPVPSCQRNVEWHIGLTFLGIVVLAATAGFASRRLVNHMAALREDGGYSARFSGIATALSLAVVLTALGALYVLASL